MGNSHQKGWVSLRGKKWYGYFRRTVLDPGTNEPKIVSTPIPLGLKARMAKCSRLTTSGHCAFPTEAYLESR